MRNIIFSHEVEGPDTHGEVPFFFFLVFFLVFFTLLIRGARKLFLVLVSVQVFNPNPSLFLEFLAVVLH